MENGAIDFPQYSLKEHQTVLFEMLKIIDDICNKYDIHYMLFAGTALGAVRHNGFVPWDDDLDVIMSRDDYNKFLSVAPESLDGALYFLQKEHSEHWCMCYSKLRKNGTACLEKFFPKDKCMHQGVFVDIFPFDNLSDNRFLSKIQFFFSRIVLAKCLNKRGYISNGFIKKVFIVFCGFLPLGPLVRFTMLSGSNDSKCVHCFFGGASKYNKSTFNREWLTETVPMRFEGEFFPVSKFYDELLSRLYGDYLKIPSVEERKCKAHAAFVDLHKSYEAYLDMQHSMKFDGLSRSIR